jgi:hypothetical protein
MVVRRPLGSTRLKWIAPPSTTLFLKFVEPQIEKRCVTRRHAGFGLASLARTERSLAMLDVGVPAIARAKAKKTDRFIVLVPFASKTGTSCAVAHTLRSERCQRGVGEHRRAATNLHPGK